jgi:hypothetical protein
MEVDLIDPNIVVYYPLDETQGRDVLDESGNYFDAWCGGTPHWEPDNGRYGGCMHFSIEWGWDGDEFDWINEEPGNIEADDGEDIAEMIDKEITICVWVNGDPNQRSESGQDMVVFEFGDDDSEEGFAEEPDDTRVLAIVPTGPSKTGDVVFRAGLYPEDTLVWKGYDPVAARGTWQHFAFVKNDNDANMYIYVNAELVATKTDCNGTSLADVDDGDPELKLGAYHDNSDDYHGRLDEFQMYNKALGPQKIEEILRGGELAPAWLPSPYDGQGNVSYVTDLTWRAGAYVADTNGHDVYFGTDYDDVFDANSTVPGPNVAHDSCSVTSYDPGTLELGQTYYWRVDEVNDPCLWKGRVWKFTVADFIVLDDFEQYDLSDNKITYTWYDGPGMPSGQKSGSVVSLAKQDPVNGGEQAMKYVYEIDDVYFWVDLSYADACLPLDEIAGFTDWTTSFDVRLLTIFFYGQPDNDTNDTEQMYLGVHDSSGRYAEMRYGDHSDTEDMNDLKVEEWQRWDVPLVWFTDNNAAVSADIDFSSISSVYLGFGDRFNPVDAGKGTVFFDDLRLSMAFCNPLYGPTGDLNGDCFVGVADVGEMGAQWLRHDINYADVGIVIEKPSDANLAGHYELDGDPCDSSDNDYHGTIEDSNYWTVGRVGQYALGLNGGWVVVDDNGVTPELRPKYEVSVMAWINLAAGSGDKVVVKGRNDHETYGLEVNDEYGGLTFLMRDVNEVQYNIQGEQELPLDEWVHIAGTYDGNEMTAYVNGEVEGTTTPGPNELYSDANDGFGIGGRWGDDDGRFVGEIDDVRVYDYGLSLGEVGWFASEGTGVILMKSEANLYLDAPDPEVINFRDFAKLFDYWGDERLWPAEPVP